MRSMSVHLSLHGVLPVDDTSIVTLVHHARAIKVLTMSLVAASGHGTATGIYPWDMHESRQLRDASEFLTST